ncbi:hypothetical protein [Actinoplanes sp. NPDC023714]
MRTCAVRRSTIKRRHVTRRFGARPRARLRIVPRWPRLRWSARLSQTR